MQNALEDSVGIFPRAHCLWGNLSLCVMAFIRFTLVLIRFPRSILYKTYEVIFNLDT